MSRFAVGFLIFAAAVAFGGWVRSVPAGCWMLNLLILALWALTDGEFES